MEEIDLVKSHLDEVGADVNIFDNQKSAKDIIFNCWPPILAPNPLLPFMHEWLDIELN
jgi:hypothetical protein